MSEQKSKGTVLLTGACGFTGRYLREVLEKSGYDVVGFVRRPAGEKEAIVDLCDLEALTNAVEQIQPDYVIHLAAISFVGHADAQDLYRVNLFGTLNLLQALQQAGVMPQKILIASSANVYGNPKDVSKVSEAICAAPVNHYAMSKLAMEHMVNTWQEQFPILIVRPFNYTGVGQNERFVVPKIVAHFQRKEPVLRLGNMYVEREFNDVRFVAEVYTQLLESTAASDTVNVCTGQGYTLNALLEKLTAISGHEIEAQVDPKFVRANELKVLIGDNTKLNAIVGELTAMSLDKTLDWMYREGA